MTAKKPMPNVLYPLEEEKINPIDPNLSSHLDTLLKKH